MAADGEARPFSVCPTLYKPHTAMSETKAVITRVDPDIADEVKQRAEQDHRSIASWLRHVIHDALEDEREQTSQMRARDA